MAIMLIIMIVVVKVLVIIVLLKLLKIIKVVLLVMQLVVIFFVVVMVCILEICEKNYICIHIDISLNCTSLTDTKKVIQSNLQHINGSFASYYMVDTSIYIIYMVNNTYIACVSIHEKLRNLRKKIISHIQWVYVDAQKIHVDYIKWVPIFIKLWLVFLLIVQWLCMFIIHIVIVHLLCENIWFIFRGFQVFSKNI